MKSVREPKEKEIESTPWRLKSGKTLAEHALEGGFSAPAALGVRRGRVEVSNAWKIWAQLSRTGKDDGEGNR